MKKKAIGQIIENEVRKQQITIVDFAKMICCTRNNVYDIFKRDKIDIIQLKHISKVLKRNFFKELSEDMELIREDESDGKAVAQFFTVVPDILRKLGKSPIIVANSDYADDEECLMPDFGLPDYYISFTKGNTLRERIGDNPNLPIESVSNDSGCVVEVCKNMACRSVYVNVKLDYRTEEDWYGVLDFAFKTYDKHLADLLAD